MKKFRRTKKGIEAAGRPQPKPKTKKVWAIAVVLVMAFSIVGFLTIDLGDVENYNGHTISVSPDNTWRLADHEEIPFRFHPADLESVPFAQSTMKTLKESTVIFMTSSVEDQNQETISKTSYDLLLNYQKNDLQVLTGFAEENEFNRPVITCANASSLLPVIYFESGDATENLSITDENNCIKVTAAVQQDFDQVKERILYGFFNVLEDDAYADYLEKRADVKTNTT